MNLIQKLSLGALALPALSAAAQQTRPNIILIMTDQQSYNAISAHADLYGGSYFKTPNIDRLAKEGISFTRTYCANPVSVPSRFALFTGRFGGAYGVRDNQTRAAEETETRSMLATNGMGGVFERGGYDTYYGGKVHLPFSGTAGKNKMAAPIGYGFNDYFIKDEREALGVASAELIERKAKEGADKPFLMVASFLNPHDICLESSTNVSATIKTDGSPRMKPIVECVQMMRTRAAAIDSVEFYRKHAPQLPANLDATVGYPAMKKAPNKDFPDWYWRKYRWTYGQLVSLVDNHIGRILDALDRNPELKKNTIVVFTSDHGEMQGAHRTVTKNLPYEECQRVPLIFAGRGIKAGARDNSLVCNGVDLLPTLCELAGITAPKTDGLSLASRMNGKDKKTLRETLYVEGHDFLNVIDGANKYTLFDKIGDGKEMLIDLHTDGGEMKNVLVGNEATAARLKQNIATHPMKAEVAKEKKQVKKDKKDGRKGKKSVGGIK